MSHLADDRSRYGLLSRALHWLTLLLVVEQFTLAWTWGHQPRAAQDHMIDLHRAVGVAVLATTVLRLAWRAANRHLAGPDLPAWQAAAARSVHAALYALLLAIPLSGWAHSSAAGYDVRLPGLTLPRLLSQDPGLRDLTAVVHRDLGLVLLALVTLHAVAGLRHAMLGDGVARRML